MYRVSKFVASLALLLSLSDLALAQDGQNGEWELKRDREGIQVYTRAVAGSPYRAVKATTIMSGISLTSLVALIEDAEACPDWADKCAESYLLEQISPTESLVYTHNDMPFPVKDRDVVARVRWQQDADSLAVRMDSEAVSGGVDEIRGRLRLAEAKAAWIFTPLSDGRIEISNEAHINPGSSLPGWVTNMLLVDTPFETIKAFRAAVTAAKYQQAELSFIREPQ